MLHIDALGKKLVDDAAITIRGDATDAASERDRGVDDHAKDRPGPLSALVVTGF